MAVLLNPAGGTTGVRTMNAVGIAAEMLGYADTRCVNLCLTPTASVVELNRARDTEGWLGARRTLVNAINGAHGVLGAWGVAGLTGTARAVRDAQVEWLRVQLLGAGFEEVWMVGGEPRHPSRWHQFVADKHGRTRGGTFSERLSQVLAPVRISEMPSRCRPRLRSSSAGHAEARMDE